MADHANIFDDDGVTPHLRLPIRGTITSNYGPQ